MNSGSVEWLAKSYVDLLTELNDDKISLKQFEIRYVEILEQAKEMEVAGREMSYSEGYKEGYKRALDYMTMSIKNAIETKDK